MKKSGFTMIELIFVIVILGILAAVALPKFVGAGNEAHVGNLKSFQGSLNRTVAATAWAKVASQDGNLSKLTGNDQLLTTYTEIPTEFTSNGSNDANLSDTGTTEDATNLTDILGNSVKCSSTLYKLQKTGDGGEFDAKIGNQTYRVDVCNGTSTTAPKFYIIKN